MKYNSGKNLDEVCDFMDYSEKGNVLMDKCNEKKCLINKNIP